MIIKALKLIGYDIPSNEHDDSFYEELEKVIKTYQQSSALYSIGSMEPKTVSCILKDLDRLALKLQ